MLVPYALVLRRQTGDEPREAELPPGLSIESRFELDGEQWVITGKTSAIEYGLRALSAFVCEPIAPEAPPTEAALGARPTSPIGRADGARIFISYSHADKPAAHALRDALDRAGCHVWIDERELRVGDSIMTAIARAITEADFFLPLVSAEAMKSPWCQKELQLAMTRALSRDGREMKVLPVRIGDVAMPLELGDLLYLEFEARNADEAVRRLVRDIVSHYGDRAVVRSAVVADVKDTTDPLLVPGSSSQFSVGAPQNVASAIQPIHAIPLRVPLENVGDVPAFITDAIGNSRDYGRLTVRPPTAIAAGAAGYLDCFVSTVSGGSKLNSGDRLEFEVRYYRGGTTTFESLRFVMTYYGVGGWQLDGWDAKRDEIAGLDS